MNPIVKREFFVRWRDWRSHLLLFGLTLLLCIAAYWSYSSALNSHSLDYRVYPPRPIAESLATRASRTGHALFSTLAIGNVLVWFLMAPILTATSVARERERGLLESLQLSHMSARSQVIARAMSALLYLFALQLMTLPVYFVAFSFGGVAPGEIGRAWLLVGATAWCGVGLGLMISAGAARPSGALFSAIGLLCAWSLAPYFGINYAFSPWGLFGFGPSTKPLAQAIYWSHPIVAVYNLCEPNLIRPIPWSGRGNTLWPFSLMLPLCILAWFCVGAFALRKATRDVIRAFAPAGWAGRNPVVEKWKQDRQKRLEEQRQRASSVEGALLADLPFDKLIRFKNPLLNREVKGRFRLRRASTLLWIGRAAVFLFAIGAWVMAMTLVFDGVGRPSAAPALLWAVWILGVALIGTFAASSFAREREAGTWEGVRLSLLSNGEIARTKWGAPLISFAILSCPLWVLLFAFAPIGGWSGVPFRVLFAGALVVASSLSLISALAVWISLRSRNTTTATCWTLGLVAFLFCGAPVAWQSFDLGPWIANRITGITPLRPAFVGTNEDWWREQPEVRERYTLETGHRAPRLYYYAPNATYTTRNISSSAAEIEEYQAWCRAKQQQSARVVVFSGAWSTALVIDQVGDPKNNATVTPNTVVQLSLIHAVLCCAAIALLIGATTLRLGARPQ